MRKEPVEGTGLEEPACAPVPSSSLRPAKGRLRRLRGESGQGVVEFAMLVPLICVLVVVFVDFGKAMNFWIDTTHAANEGARLAAVNIDVTKPPYSSAGVSNLHDYIQKELEGGQLRDGATVSICLPEGAALGSPVTVQVSYPYKFIPFIGRTATIKSRATMRLEHDATNFTAVGTCA